MNNDRFGVGLYSPRVAARIARIKYQHFQAWAKANLLHPSKLRTGKNTESVYSYTDLLLIRLVVRLKENANFDIKRIRDINPDAVRRDHDLMLVALDAGVAVLAPGMTSPVQ